MTSIILNLDIIYIKSLVIIFFELFLDWFLFQLFYLVDQIVVLFEYFFIKVLTGCFDLHDILGIYFLVLNALTKQIIDFLDILLYSIVPLILA